MLVQSSGADDVGLAAFRVAETAGATNHVLVLGHGVRHIAGGWVDEPDDHHSGCGRVYAHGERGRGHEDAELGVLAPKLFLKNLPLSPVEVGVVEGDAAAESPSQPLRRRRRVASRQRVQRLLGRSKPETGSQILGATYGLALDLAEDDDLLALLNELGYQGDDQILAAVLATPLGRDDAFGRLAATIIKEAVRTGTVEYALDEWHGPCLVSQVPAVEPPLQATRVTDHCRQADELRFNALGSPALEQGQDEFEVGATVRVDHHLHFVNHDGADLAQEVRTGQHHVTELLV